jgi:hypothetical protein
VLAAARRILHHATALVDLHLLGTLLLLVADFVDLALLIVPLAANESLLPFLFLDLRDNILDRLLRFLVQFFNDVAHAIAVLHNPALAKARWSVVPEPG